MIVVVKKFQTTGKKNPLKIVTFKMGICIRFLYMFLISCIICYTAMSNLHSNSVIIATTAY